MIANPSTKHQIISIIDRLKASKATEICEFDLQMLLSIFHKIQKDCFHW